MNELSRMHYLDAMGIATFVPRRVLINSAQLKHCVLPIAAEPIAAKPMLDERMATPATNSSTPNVASANSDELSPRSVRDLSEGLSDVLAVLGLGDKTKPANKATPESKVAGAALALTETPARVDAEHVAEQAKAAGSALALSQQAASFQLALYELSNAWQLIDSQVPGDALPTTVLLRSILASCCGFDDVPAMELQRWPMHSRANQDQSWHAAADMMFDFLDGRMARKPFTALVLMGDDAARAVLGADIDLEAQRFCVSHSDRFQLPVLVLPALRDLLYQPELKARLWRAFALLNT